jgi:hypothetical protein
MQPMLPPSSHRDLAETLFTNRHCTRLAEDSLVLPGATSLTLGGVILALLATVPRWFPMRSTSRPDASSPVDPAVQEGAAGTAGQQCLSGDIRGMGEIADAIAQPRTHHEDAEPLAALPG